MNLKIRKFRQSDINNLISILRSNQQYDFPDIEGPKAMIRVAQRQAAVFLFAEVTQRVLGCIKGVYDGSRALIHLISIAPDYQKQGIGTKLVNAIISEFQQRAATTISVTVIQRSLGFWEKLQFKQLV